MSLHLGHMKDQIPCFPNVCVVLDEYEEILGVFDLLLPSV